VVIAMETPERIVAAITHCLAGKYAGLFEPRNGAPVPKRKAITLLPVTDGSDQ